MMSSQELINIRAHYEIERELAGKLRKASREERMHLYSSLYDELFQRVPFHPQLKRKKTIEENASLAERQFYSLKRLIKKNAVFLEVGPGDCSFSIEVAKHVKKVFAVDVSAEITKLRSIPDNLEVIISDGCSIPVSKGSVDIAYSNQLMEHLHSEDAVEQLKNIFTTLVLGGKYICITPNRLSGPHDVSMYFDEVATGFHLFEYTSIELIKLFKSIGFSRVKVYIGFSGTFYRCPILPIAFSEMILGLLPNKYRKICANLLPFRSLLNTRIVGIK